MQVDDGGARELGRVRAIEDGKADAVEADEAVEGAEPEVPVRGLDHGRRRVLGQALIGLPHVDGVFGIVSSVGRGATGDQEGQNHGQGRRGVSAPPGTSACSDRRRAARGWADVDDGLVA